MATLELSKCNTNWLFLQLAISVIAFILANVLVTSASPLPLRYCSTPLVLLFDKFYANMMMLTLNHRMTAFNTRLLNPQTSEIVIGASFLSAPPNTSQNLTKSDTESHVSIWDSVPGNNFMMEVRRSLPLAQCANSDRRSCYYSSTQCTILLIPYKHRLPS